MIHAVESEHTGKGESCVVYVAATPRTGVNEEYIGKQVEAFLGGGKVPEDFW